MSIPSQDTVPAVGRVMVVMVFINVVLPAPFGPNRPITPELKSSLNSQSPHTPLLYFLPTLTMLRFTVSLTPAYWATAWPLMRGTEGRSRRAGPGLREGRGPQPNTIEERPYGPEPT